MRTSIAFVLIGLAMLIYFQEKLFTNPIYAYSVFLLMALGLIVTVIRGKKNNGNV